MLDYLNKLDTPEFKLSLDCLERLDTVKSKLAAAESLAILGNEYFGDYKPDPSALVERFYITRS